MVHLVRLLHLDGLLNPAAAQANAAVALEHLAAVRRERDEVDAFLARRDALSRTGTDG